MAGLPLDAFVHGALVIWPPDEVRAEVDVLRHQYDPVSAARCEAHITVSQPFIHQPTDADITRLAGLLSALDAITVSYGAVDTFLPYPCLYLSVEPLDRLTALHEVVQGTGLFHPDPAHYERFVPHMTILEGSLSPEETARLAIDIQPTAPRGTFVCREVALVVPDEHFRFTVTQRFGLGRSIEP